MPRLRFVETVLQVQFTGDELILALMSLIRATNPAMLRGGPDGFTVDFESLDAKSELSADERSLLKFRAALEGNARAAVHTLELDPVEARRLARTLHWLESLQPWPLDVLEMSGKLRARLLPE